MTSGPGGWRKLPVCWKSSCHRQRCKRSGKSHKHSLAIAPKFIGSSTDGRVTRLHRLLSELLSALDFLLPSHCYRCRASILQGTLTLCPCLHLFFLVRCLPVARLPFRRWQFARRCHKLPFTQKTFRSP